MKHLKRSLLYFLHDESGQDLMEYALAAGLLGAGAVVALQGAQSGVQRGIQTGIGSAFNLAANSLVSRF